MIKSILLGSCLITTTTFANDITKIKPMGNIYGSNGGIQKPGKFKIGIIYDLVTKNQAYNGNDKIIDNKKRDITTKSTKFKFKYGFYNGIELSTVIPHLDMKWSSFESGQIYHNTNSGLQDIQLMLRYGLLNQKKGDSFYLSIGAGVELPTGQTNKTFSNSKGNVIIASKQLGTGSYDYIGHIGFTKLFHHTRIDASVKYQQNNLGDNQFEKGDVLALNVGYNYAFNKSFDLQLEIDAKMASKDKEKDIINLASGGNTIYITPGFHYRIMKPLSIGMVIPIVIKRDMNYDVVKSVGGLSEDNRVVFKLEYTF